METVKLPVYGITLELHSISDLKSGSIISDLKSECPHCSKYDCFFDCDESVTDDGIESEDDARERIEVNRMYDGIESLILSCACNDIDIETPAFLSSIETAINAVENNLL